MKSVHMHICISEIYISEKYLSPLCLRRSEKMKTNLLQLFRTAIAAVDPYTCVKHHLVVNDEKETEELHIGNNHVTLNHNLYVAAFGKAALGIDRFRRQEMYCLFFVSLQKACVEQWMKFAINIFEKVLSVYLWVPLNKRKGKNRFCSNSLSFSQ